MQSKVSKPSDSWYKQPWLKITGVVITVATLFGSGFSAGQIYTKNEANLNEMKIRYEYETKLQEEKEECMKEKLEFSKISFDKLENVMTKIKR